MNKRDELVNKKNEADNAYYEIHEYAVRYVTDKLTDWLMKLEIANFAKVARVSEDHANILIPRKDEGYFHDIDLYFRQDWLDRAKKRTLEMNCGTFGSFKSTDIPECRYYIVIGKLTEHLAEIEADIQSFDWQKFNELQKAHYTADNELQKYDQAVKKAEDLMKAEELRKKIRVGVKVICGKQFTYNRDTKKYEDVDEVKTIGNVTAKNILFNEDYGRRTKIEDLIQKLMSGTWKFAENGKQNLN